MSVIPLVANAGFDNVLMHRILTDQVIREWTILSIVRFVLDGNYFGINIDWENIPAENRGSLNSYMKEISEKLHDYGKFVTIDVSGKVSDETTGWSGTWDYEALEELCDYVCIMVYDYHWSGSESGPVGPGGMVGTGCQIYSFLETKGEDSDRHSILRIRLGWKQRGYVSFDRALSIAKEKDAKITFSENDGEYTYSYDVFFSKNEVWFQGAKSVEVKIKIVLTSGIDKIAA